MTNELRPALMTDQLYPPDTAFMARTDLVETRMLGFTGLHLDTVTTTLAGVLNGLCTVRHEAGAGSEVIELYRRAGIRFEEELRTFQTQEEAEAIAEDLIARGKRLCWPYPPPANRYPEGAQLVSTELYRFLNAKINLPALVPPQHLAKSKDPEHRGAEGVQVLRTRFPEIGWECGHCLGFCRAPLS